MAKVKVKKNAATIDMTAMCDVSFLLLTFFILTATAKQPEPLPVDAPASTVQTKLPTENLAMITVGLETETQPGKVFYNIVERDVRMKTLELIGEKYGVPFSDEEKKRFSLIENFGMPVQQLKGFIALDATARNAVKQPGIPMDSLNNQLADWVKLSRRATIDLKDKQLKLAIKGDQNKSYPEIKKIMDILQDQEVNSFNLVTGLRGEDF